MAITKIHAIKKTLSKSIKYIENPNKTDGQMLISGYNVEPLTASIEFEMTTALAKEVKGNYSKTGGSNNLAYHMIQSFSPEDNVTAEQAHKIGQKLADEFLDGKYEYVIATHVDKGHIHNHIIFNATSFYDLKKMHTQPYKTAAKIRAISDRLCSENELSVITEKGNLGHSYAEYKARKQNTSWKSEIRKRLNYLLELEVNYNTFVENAKSLGVTVNDTGKHIKYLFDGQKKYSRGNKLSDTDKYTKEGILEQLALNEKNQEYLKTSIKEAATQSEDYNEFIALMKERYSVAIKKQKSDSYVFVIDDINNSKVKEEALGEAFTIEVIKTAIKQKEFDFSERMSTENILEKYNSVAKTKVEENDTRLVLNDENISKITVDGILIEMPDHDGKVGKIFIDNRHINYMKKSKEYEIFIGDKYDYYFVNDVINPDIAESEQLSGKYVKGENVIRTLEKQNGVKSVEIEISEQDIKAISQKGITLSLPDKSIDSLFIENEYVVYDKLNSSCKINFYENWNYSFRRSESNDKNLLTNIKGQSIIKLLDGRKQNKEYTLRGRIAAFERRNIAQNTKALAESLLLMRRKNIEEFNEFDINIDKLKSKATEVRNDIKIIDKKNTQYKEAVKYLISYNKYLPIKLEYEKQTILTRKRFYRKNESELMAFEYAVNKLEKLKINTSVDSDKVLGLVKQQNKKITELEEEFKQLEEQIDELRKAKEAIEEVIIVEEDQQLEEEEQKQEKERKKEEEPTL